MPLNVSADLPDEQLRPLDERDNMEAMLNILADFSEDKARLNDLQRAVLNILDDAQTEHARSRENQRAVLNILEDVEGEKNRMKELQNAVMNILDDLDGEMAERKLASNAQLQSNRELARANDELNNFAYVASHDLKSPLRGIDQLATWIVEDMGDDLSDETQNHLRLMRSRIKRMEMLLNDLLAYSRVGRMGNEVVQVDTREIVESIFDLVAANRNIRLVLSDNMPVLETRKVPLELVFRNLIGNAVKHHDKPQGTIAVSARPIPDGIEFEIRDDGPGVAPEHQQRVFAMFQTLKPRDEVEGSGMGLALVKKAVESMNGTITLESDGQHGCTFRFTWPDIHHEEETA